MKCLQSQYRPRFFIRILKFETLLNIISYWDIKKRIKSEIQRTGVPIKKKDFLDHGEIISRGFSCVSGVYIF